MKTVMKLRLKKRKPNKINSERELKAPLYCALYPVLFIRAFEAGRTGSHSEARAETTSEASSGPETIVRPVSVIVISVRH